MLRNLERASQVEKLRGLRVLDKMLFCSVAGYSEGCGAQEFWDQGAALRANVG